MFVRQSESGKSIIQKEPSLDIMAALSFLEDHQGYYAIRSSAMDEDGHGSDAEDNEILSKDIMLLTANTEDDHSYIEVHLYNAFLSACSTYCF